MHIIPLIAPRPSARGLLVAASLLLPARAEAIQETSPEPRAAASQEGVPEAKEATPPATKSEARAADDRKRTDGQGTPRTSTPSAAVPPKPAGGNGTAPGKVPPSRLPASRTGQAALAAEKAAIDKVTAKTSIEEILAVTLPSRTDRHGDWSAGPEPLHRCGEPRWIEPCIPLPPCHPSLPPHPYDLVGVAGQPTAGPIYGGPCCPRTGSRDDGPWPHLHRVHDRFFDAFYRTK